MLFTTTTYNTEGLILMFMIAENNQIITQILDLLSKESIISHLRKDLFTLVIDVQKLTDELARNIIRTVLEVLDRSLVESEQRKKNWTIQRRRQPKTIATSLGPITYERTYFRTQIP